MMCNFAFFLTQNGKSGSSPTKTDGALIMPKKKPSVHAAQDGVRSDLLKAIRDGKCIQTRCKNKCIISQYSPEGSNPSQKEKNKEHGL